MSEEPCDRFRDLCRSALAIARRNGEKTNWPAFTAQLERALADFPATNPGASECVFPASAEVAGEQKPNYKANVEWLKANAKHYAGAWVALKDGELLASDYSHGGLLKRVGPTKGTGILITFADSATPVAQPAGDEPDIYDAVAEFRERATENVIASDPTLKEAFDIQRPKSHQVVQSEADPVNNATSERIENGK